MLIFPYPLYKVRKGIKRSSGFNSYNDWTDSEQESIYSNVHEYAFFFLKLHAYKHHLAQKEVKTYRHKEKNE